MQAPRKGPIRPLLVICSMSILLLRSIPDLRGTRPYSISIAVAIDDCGNHSGPSVVFEQGWRDVIHDLALFDDITDPVELITPIEPHNLLPPQGIRYLRMRGATPVEVVELIDGALESTALSLDDLDTTDSGPPVLLAGTRQLVYPGDDNERLWIADVDGSSWNPVELSESVGAVGAMGYDAASAPMILLDAPSYTCSGSDWSRRDRGSRRWSGSGAHRTSL